VAYKVLDICTDALFENGAYGIDTPVLSAADGQMALRWLNRRLNAWAALKRYAYNVSFTEYTLTPNHQPHLIGPALNPPDFAAAQRPVRIEGAALVLNNVTPNVDLGLNIRDDAWWQAQTVKSIATTTPTDLYYSPDWPNGALWLWPVPTFAYGLRLEVWGLISAFVTLNSVFTLPLGYESALVLTLAEDLCRPFGRPLTQDLRDAAREARAALQTNNIKSPRIASADYGSSGSRGGRRGGFNYYTGQ
jgi:hypothetical protein